MIVHSGGRAGNIAFGDSLRGLSFEGIEIDSDDIRTMLVMNEHDLKDNLHKILCSIVQSPRHNSPHRRYPSNDKAAYGRSVSQEMSYDARAVSEYHRRVFEAEARAYEMDNAMYSAKAFDADNPFGIPPATDCNRISKKPGLPVKDSSGLVWTDE